MAAYKTLNSKSTALYKEKGSKFHAYAYPIQSAEDIKGILLQIQEEHPKARHICTAFLIGSGPEEYYLTNDDGEPTNSAGAPILGQIRSHGITNAFIAVVRYFGGVKLGVGGLIQAYKTAAAEAIEANEIIEVEHQSNFSFRLSYEKLGDALSVIDRNNLTVDIKNEEEAAVIVVSCLAKDLEKVKALLDRFL